MRNLLIGLATTLMFGCGGKKNPKSPDDPITGGEEPLNDSFACLGIVPSLDKDGKPDPVRGFKAEIIAFLYKSGSVAITLKTDYTYKKDVAPITDVATRVYPQNATQHFVETELLLAKVWPGKREADLFKKYKSGAIFSMECK